MNLDKFVHSSTGRYMMSIILGLGLATLFRQVCKGSQCKVLRAPPLEEIDEEVYKIGDKCYKYDKNSVKCDKTKRILSFA